jgi:hypothetical protein
VDQLNQLRAWAGRPSFRTLRDLAGVRPGTGDPPMEALPTSTTHEILAGKRLPRLPRLDFVETFVAACLRAGRCLPEEIEAEVGRWRGCWRALTQASAVSTVDGERHGSPLGDAGRPGGRWRAGGRWLVPAVVVAAVFAAGTAAGRLLPAGSARPIDGGPGQPSATLAHSVAELVVNGTFDPPIDPWWRHGRPVVLVDGRARVEVADEVDKPWHDALGQSSISLRKNRTYTLGFDVSVDAERTFQVLIQTETPPRQTVLSRHVTLTPSAPSEMRSFAFRFVSPLTAGNGQILFHFGGPGTGYTVHLDNVSLVEHPN